MAKQKLDTRSIGLDVGLSLAKWLTGMENLHYGDWTDLDVTAGNVGRAQEAYTDRLFRYLPDRPCRILDIGGGAGETARKLIALGHDVEIVIPSAFLASRCRENAPQAVVHEMTFEAFESDARFDVCLFSESYQYIPLHIGLAKALRLLRTDGRVVLADCFRTDAYKLEGHKAIVGGGHPISAFRDTVAGLNLEVLNEADITVEVAPTVEIEQGFYNVFGHGLTRVDEELAIERPKTRWLIQRAINTLMSERKRVRLHQRLMEHTRNRDVFAHNNIYLMMGLRPR